MTVLFAQIFCGERCTLAVGAALIMSACTAAAAAAGASIKCNDLCSIYDAAQLAVC